MRTLAFFIFLLSSAAAAAAGGSAAAIPTKVDILRADGFVIFGSFGNPGGCTFSDQLFVRSDHPQYKQLYAAALAALVSKQKISAYVHGCEPIPWYAQEPQTFNTVQPYSSLAIEI